MTVTSGNCDGPKTTGMSDRLFSSNSKLMRAVETSGTPKSRTTSATSAVSTVPGQSALMRSCGDRIPAATLRTKWITAALLAA